MEEAIFIAKLNSLKQPDPKYTRVYFGNEFCQRLIPKIPELDTALKLVKAWGRKFTLVTPYVTEDGLAALRPVLEHTEKNWPGSEVVVNDWGVLRLVAREFKNLEPLLGRLLTKQKRGPRLIKLQDRVPEAMLDHFRRSNVDVPILSGFLARLGVKRVELDNLLQGLVREGLCQKGSLYLPYAYVATTRYCISASAEKSRKFLRSMPACSNECRKYVFKLSHPDTPVDLFLKGNAQFFYNDRVPENLETLNIDRIVYEPEIPV